MDIENEPTTKIFPAGSSAKAVLRGSLLEGATGLAALVLAIIALAGIYPWALAGIVTVLIGLGALGNAGVLGANFSRLSGRLSKNRLQSIEVSGGLTAEFIGGAVGTALGVLALLGVSAHVMLPIAVLIFGLMLVLDSGLVARLASIGGGEETFRGAARACVWAATSTQLLMGFGTVVLGILALCGIATLGLSLVSLLAISVTSLLSGMTIGSRILATATH